MYGLQTNIINNSWQLIRSTDTRVPPQTTWIRTCFIMQFPGDVCAHCISKATSKRLESLSNHIKHVAALPTFQWVKRATIYYLQFLKYLWVKTKNTLITQKESFSYVSLANTVNTGWEVQACAYCSIAVAVLNPQIHPCIFHTFKHANTNADFMHFPVGFLRLASHSSAAPIRLETQGLAEARSK